MALNIETTKFVNWKRENTFHLTERKLQNLPSTTGKFDKKATKAGGVASNISSNALIVWPPTAAITGFDKDLEAVGTPAAVVVWKFPAPTVKEN